MKPGPTDPRVVPADPAHGHLLHEAAHARLAWQALCSVDAAVSIVDVRSPDQPLVFVNEAFCRLTGYDESELLGQNCRMLQHAEIDPVALDTLRCGIAAGQPVGAVLRNRRRNGSTFWNALHVVPLSDADGQVTHYAGFQRDVAESSLTAHAVLSMDELGPAEARGRFDRAIADALRQQAAGRQRHVLIVICGADFPAALPLQQRMAVASQLQPFMAPTAALCFLDRGAVALLTPVRDDETPGWVAEKVHDMVKASWPCGVGLAEPFVDGDDGQTLLAAARAAAERAARAGVPGPCHADPTRDTRDRPRMLQGPNTDPAERQRIREALARWQPVTVDLLNYTRSGEPYWVEMTISPVADETGAYRYWFSVERDITARKLASQALLARHVELEARVSARTQELQRTVRDLEFFNRAVAHDLQNPLNGVRGFAEMMALKHGPALSEDGGACWRSSAAVPTRCTTSSGTCCRWAGSTGCSCARSTSMSASCAGP